MPTEPAAGRRSLADYITMLIAILGQGEPPALARLRAVVGGRRALIVLDAEAVVVTFRGADLVIRPAPVPQREDDPGLAELADGAGRADTGVVLDLLDGRIELADAVAQGRIAAAGPPDGIDMILHAVEILLDAATRVPALRSVSAEFRVSRPVSGSGPLAPPPRAAGETEEALLERLDLLPGSWGTRPTPASRHSRGRAGSATGASHFIGPCASSGWS